MLDVEHLIIFALVLFVLKLAFDLKRGVDDYFQVEDDVWFIRYVMSLHGIPTS